jgi:hypothetical protein
MKGSIRMPPYLEWVAMSLSGATVMNLEEYWTSEVARKALYIHGCRSVDMQSAREAAANQLRAMEKAHPSLVAHARRRRERRRRLARWISWLGRPVFLLGLVPGFPHLLLRVIRASQKGYSGSQMDRYVAESWLFVYLWGLLLWAVALLGGIGIGLWFLLK